MTVEESLEKLEREYYKDTRAIKICVRFIYKNHFKLKIEDFDGLLNKIRNIADLAKLPYETQSKSITYKTYRFSIIKIDPNILYHRAWYCHQYK
ncbi:hypothetical protein P0136_02915 [Lentisphaerota bacterium ZTH]|nr:hypothetical protein JYG24_05945 [Lentisphaerota bacterium]WET06953.1 hypothetical protein P0136_02915 [Lentisphaerota bacterium ZTH]